MNDKKSIYETLREVDVTRYARADQGGHKYVPWSNAWAILKKHYPQATFHQHLNDVGDAFFVSTMGVEVRVTVTIDKESQTFTHPVLNSINKSMKIDKYTYTTKKGDRHVEACSSFDINSARARALVKCIALFGLGLDVYSDDLQPEIELIDSKGLQMIVDKIKEKGFILSEICAEWQIPKISSLHAVNVDTMLDFLDSRK